MRSVIAFFVISILIWVVPKTGKGQTQLQGKVLDEKTLQPISGANVRALYLPMQYKTNSNGFFKLEQIPLGELELIINRIGYSTVTLKTNIKQGVNGVVIKLPVQELPPLTSMFKELNEFREKVVVVTDKPYYYPGEIIWLKAFMNYLNPKRSDSLSRVVYVDLIGLNEKKKQKVIQRQVLSLDSGRFAGSIAIPDKLKSGNYILRAHTAFMRNFGEDQFFYKTIPVLNSTDHVPLNDYKLKENDSYKIVTDKEVYNSRSKVLVQIKLPNDKLESNLSIAVTDLSQVSPIPEANLINSWGFDEGIDKISAVEFKHVVENGIRFVGHFVSEYQTGKKVTLTVFTKDLFNSFEFETDDKGWFQVNGLKFYDSTTFYYTAKRGKKGDSYEGSIQMELSDFELSNPQAPGLWFKVDSTSKDQRVLANYLAPPEVRMLEEVNVTASRFIPPQKRSILTNADKVFKAENLQNNGNILLSLQSRVPGLNINCNVNPCQVRIARAGSVGTSGEPMVLINNVPIGGPPGITLQNINLNSVERIEISTRQSVLYGGDSRNGIIAVYLKDGYSSDSNFKGITPSFELKGFTRPMKFVSPDYNDQEQETSMSDYRSTLYWNPELTKDTTSNAYGCSFFTSDVPGKYRIVVQGVTSDHKPIWVEKIIEVRD